MRFTQRAFLYNRAEFDFGDREVHVVIDDGRLQIGFSAAYHEIATKKSIKSFPEKAFMRCAIAILMAALAIYVLIGSDISVSNGLVLIGFTLAGLLLCVVSGYAKFDATRIPVVSGNTILVFHDSQHHIILSEIYKRRKSELLRLHGEVDTLNHPQFELKKFLWLREEDAINEQELNEARVKIAALSKTPTQLL